jgi:DNA-directed RNA polymerase specialized sigma subunit
MSRPEDHAERLSPHLQRIVEDHRWIADVVAARYASRYPRFDRDDVRSVSHEALVRAALDFDEGRQVLFRSHAYARVDLAVRDFIRGERKRRRTTQSVRAGDEALAEYAEGSMGPPSPFASPDEVASDYRDELFGALAAYLIGAASTPIDPETALADRQAREHASSLLARCRASLAERDQELLRLRYEEHMGLADIQRTRFPEVPYSNLTRYHRDALVRLGKQLRKHGLSEPPTFARES